MGVEADQREKLERLARDVNRLPVAKPVMDEDAREFLRGYYRADDRALADLLGRELPWRNFTERPATPAATATGSRTAPRR